MNRDYPDHPFRLSHSMLEMLHTCERKFQLERLLQGSSSSYRHSASTIRGKAFGVGVAHYLLTGNMDAALFLTLLAYTPAMEEPPKISLARTLNNLVFAKDKLDEIRRDYSVARFNGKPAIELSFKLILDEKWYYGGSIDVVLCHKTTKVSYVFECKTTAYNLYDLTYAYKNSGQGVGYSIVVDAVAGEEQSEYGVLYFVCRDHYNDFTPDIYVWPFTKTLLDRLNWFVSLGLDYEHIKRMEEVGIFPMRGQSCIKFNKVCHHAGTCSLTGSDEPKEVTTDDTEYDFVYKLQDVIDDHIRRVKA